MAIRERQVKNKRNSNGVLTGKPGTVYDVNLKYYQNGVQKSYGKRGFVTKKDALQHEAEMRLKLQALLSAAYLRQRADKSCGTISTPGLRTTSPTCAPVHTTVIAVTSVIKSIPFWGRCG